jgi:cytochrome c-type biogenesis protein CcmH
MKAILVVLSLLLAAPALAVEPSEMLDNPVLEQRARELSAEIRCVVCQNESIDSSHAEIAHELRVLVRERLVAGESDQEVLDYLVARYGDFVLLRPPVKPATYLLWFGPFALLLIGMVAVFVFFRRQRAVATQAPALSPAEKARLSRLLAEEGIEEEGPGRA